MKTKLNSLFIVLLLIADAPFLLAQPTTNITTDGMAFIPAGAFTMGNSIGDSDITNATTVSVNLSAFYMDINLVSLSQWQSVYFWATNHGYWFSNVGSGKGANYPVQRVNWYDAIKWSNARSQQAGLTPIYYKDGSLTKPYMTGEGEIMPVYVNWAANGYRLPTEAEWEKAARGGLNGQRFPWGNTISLSQANYYGHTNLFTYNLGPNGHNVIFEAGGFPYTSPVGYFASNGYGLNDMAGNVFEWCWDRYGTPYEGGNDPHGPANGDFRVLRGGYWSYAAPSLRCAYRTLYRPNLPLNYGFRCVKAR